MGVNLNFIGFKSGHILLLDQRKIQLANILTCHALAYANDASLQLLIATLYCH